MLSDLIPRDKYDCGGRITPVKQKFIINLIKNFNLQKCLEIGVWKGSSLLTIAEGCLETEGNVVGIDPWRLKNIINDIPDRPKLMSNILNNVIKCQETLDFFYEQLTRIINENNLDKVISIHRNRSDEIFNKFSDESFDFIHIDGNHDEIFVDQDLTNYFPKLKKQGFLIMDDSDWPGVKKSIEKHLAGAELIKKEKSWMCFRKI